MQSASWTIVAGRFYSVCMATGFDTLAAAKKFQNAGMEQRQAEAFAQELASAIDDATDRVLAVAAG